LSSLPRAIAAARSRRGISLASASRRIMPDGSNHGHGRAWVELPVEPASGPEGRRCDALICSLAGAGLDGDPELT
jgi:hypothetical protein